MGSVAFYHCEYSHHPQTAQDAFSRAYDEIEDGFW